MMTALAFRAEELKSLQVLEVEKIQKEDSFPESLLSDIPFFPSLMTSSSRDFLHRPGFYYITSDFGRISVRGEYPPTTSVTPNAGCTKLRKYGSHTSNTVLMLHW